MQTYANLLKGTQVMCYEAEQLVRINRYKTLSDYTYKVIVEPYDVIVEAFHPSLMFGEL